MAMYRRTRTSQGMTLIELVTVLTVMTALATVALAGLSDLASRSRARQTADLGALLQTAVAGNGVEASRFLSDMGRLPILVSNSAGKGMGELFDSATIPAALVFSGAAAFTNATWPDSDETTFVASLLNLSVPLPCGWRGPYYAISGSELYDGWGREWQVNTGTIAVPVWTNPTTGTIGSLMRGLRSRGKDGVADTGGESWEDLDSTLPFADNLTSADLTVEVYRLDAGVYILIDEAPTTRLRVALYAPYVTDGALAVKRVLAYRAGAAVATAILPAQDADYPHTEGATWEAFSRVRLTGLSTGTRRLFVYAYDTDTTPLFPAKKSGVQLVEIKPGSNSIKVYLSQGL